MATETKEIEVWVIVDENGDYSVGNECDHVAERYEEEISGGHEVGKRQIKITLNVPLPKQIDVTVNVPEEPQEATVSVS